MNSLSKAFLKHKISNNFEYMPLLSQEALTQKNLSYNATVDLSELFPKSQSFIVNSNTYTYHIQMNIGGILQELYHNKSHSITLKSISSNKLHESISYLFEHCECSIISSNYLKFMRSNILKKFNTIYFL